MAEEDIYVGNDYGNGLSYNLSTVSDPSEALIQSMIPQVLQGHCENLSYPLTEWQESQLQNLEEPGIACLLRMWLLRQPELEYGTYCNATWDSVYCWPPTPNGNVASRECSEIFEEMKQSYASQIKGTAFRVCQDNGTWLMGNWTNYTECANSYDVYEMKSEKEKKLVVTVQLILFVGSILSLASLAGSLSIFYYFKCLWCDRVKLYVHLMTSLMFRCALLVVISEPFVFNRTNHYRNEDVNCKIVLSLNFYTAVASVNWMFIQGVYLHGKLTTNVFDKGTPFKTYYVVGWILPIGLIGLYAIVLEIYHPVKCWEGYSERPELWILVAPILLALFANLIFLINIMRIMLKKGQRNNSLSEAAQFCRALKATALLFPLLGINNLLFIYNPGGELDSYFVLLNTFCVSTQGFFVAVLCCFVSRDVREAMCREYRRILIRRSASNVDAGVRYQPQPGNSPQPQIQFYSTKVSTPRPSGESSGGRNSGTTMIEMMPMRMEPARNEVLVVPTTPSPVAHCSCCRNVRVCSSINPLGQFQQRGRVIFYKVAGSSTNFRIIDGR